MHRRILDFITTRLAVLPNELEGKNYLQEHLNQVDLSTKVKI